MASETERRTDRRTLQRLVDLAEARINAALTDKEPAELYYWEGVADGLYQALGEEIFTIQKVESFTIQRVIESPKSAVTGVAAPANSTPETDTHGI